MEWLQAPGWPMPCNDINLSEDTVRDPGFADFTISQIQNAQLPETTFIFEITLSVAILSSSCKCFRPLSVNGLS
jgi:EAL domain-containing protein (putative c-di-GMP-specific phosphodiesterase class I)